MKSILDPSFRYRTSVDTDIRATFARVRREQKRRARTPSLTGVVGRPLRMPSAQTR